MLFAVLLLSAALLTPDHLGSTTKLTNEAGMVIGEFRFRPFGQEFGGQGIRGTVYGNCEFRYFMSANAPPIGISRAIAVVAPPTPTDTIRPVVTFTTPQNGSTVSDTVPIAAQASDNIGVTQVQFFVDGTLVATDTASPYTYIWDTTQAPQVSHTLTAKAFDAAGNIGEATLTVTVANAPSALPPGTIFYLPDHVGSTTLLVDREGKVIRRLSYRPFGGFQGPMPSDGAAIHHYFTGQELDASTDLYHLGARYYDPTLGRFTQPDPRINLRDPQDGPYTYARNNPLRLIDPTGLSFHSNLGSGWGVGGFGSGLGDFVSGSLNQAWQNLTGWASQTWQGATSFLNQSINSFTTSAMGQFAGGVGYGFGTSLQSSLPWALGIGAAVLFAPELATSSVAGFAIRGLAIAGAANLGVMTAGALTGTSLTGQRLSPYERGELAGAALLGWSVLGAAWRMEAGLVLREVPSTSQPAFTPGSWLEHFQKHGADLGYSTSVEYLRGAQQLVGAGGGVQSFVRSSDSATLFYRSATNEFAVLSNNGVIKTYFRPDEGLAYWLEQIRGGR